MSDLCSVCAGTGKPVSGLPCICAGVGTQNAETDGLRFALQSANKTIEQLQGEVKLLREVVFAYKNSYKVRSPFNVDALDKALAKLEDKGNVN